MVIIEVVFPIIAIAFLGYIVALKGIFGIRDIEGISRYVFTVAIPAMLLNSLSKMELPESINWSFLLSYYLAAIFMFGLGMWLSKRWFDYSQKEQSVFGMGTSYSNAVLIGLPLISTGLGDEALLPTFMLIAVHSSIMFFLVTLFAERGAGDKSSPVTIARQTLTSLARNPIIIGIVLGLIANLLPLSMPTLIQSTLELISRSALPIALFTLGASLSAYRLAGHFRRAWAIVGLKLILQPLLVWLLAFLVFQVDPLWGAVAVMMAAMPVGINVYMFAQKYQVCLEPVSSAIVISTALAIITQSLLLAIFIP
jgi:predicted permease